MAQVYLDVSALFLHWNRPDAVVAPDAERAVKLLESDSHRVIVVGEPPSKVNRWVSRLPHAAHPDPAPQSGEPAWLIVGDRERCNGRDPRLRTVLVGGGPPPRTGRGRCDVETADLHGAVLSVIGGAAIA